MLRHSLQALHLAVPKIGQKILQNLHIERRCFISARES